MANSMYDAGRNEFAKGNIAWKAAGGSTIKAVLCSSGYVANTATHANLSDILAANRVATSAALTLIDPVAGVCDANDITISAVSGSQITQVVLYKDTGSEATSTLLVLFDTGTNLPLTPNGGDITLQWDSGANKIFKL